MVRDAETELRGCFRPVPRTQSPCVTTPGLEAGALAGLSGAQARTLVLFGRCRWQNVSIPRHRKSISWW